MENDAPAQSSVETEDVATIAIATQDSPVDESLPPQSLPLPSISPENLSPTPSARDDKDKSTTGEKINIRLNPVGNAPILKQKLWSVPADREVGQITEFVKKYLKLEKHQSLFLFVNQAFAPSPDQPLKELYECFGSDGKIVLHYSTTYAWG